MRLLRLHDGSGLRCMLASGTQLGPYEIIEPLGAGGMGEVYRAHDEQLDREVAVKILPAAVTQNPEHAARFERQARILASLNHPNIAALHGLEEAGGVRFLVLELVSGVTLDRVLASGPVTLDQALRICAQVAEALEAAHEKGIIHRDLKPLNIKLTSEGKVKVLDFELAKALAVEEATAGSEPTMSLASASGSLLGTPSYMSPEQVRGQATDKRTDIWAFGCLLYEALTGKKAFDGKTVTDTLAQIIQGEPDWLRLRRSTPASIQRLLRHCLEKDVTRRLRDVGDARLEIEGVLSQATSPATPAFQPRQVLIGVLAVAVSLALGISFLRRGSGLFANRAQPKLTQITFRPGITRSPAWSPDSEQLAYTAEVSGVRKVFRKNLGSGEERQVTTGANDDIQPSWSPDGKTLLFVRSHQVTGKMEPGDVFGQYDGGDVWRLELGSGKENKLIENAVSPAYSPDGKRIAVDASWAGPRRIWIVDGEGHNPQQVTTDASEAVAHVSPRWSPDGTKIVFQNIERTKFDIRVVNLDNRRMEWVTNDLYQDVNPLWSASGRAIYFSSYRSGGLSVWRAPVFSDGSRAGPPEQVTTGGSQDVELALSRNGKRLAFSVLKQNADLWRLPVSAETGHPTGEPQAVVASTREDTRGSWSPDGESIAFNSDRSGNMNIWLYSVKNNSMRQLTRGAGGDFQPQWSPDGKQLVFFSSRARSVDIWSVEVTTGKLRRLTKSLAVDVNPFFSPDGRWIAYQSDQSGRLEIWIMKADGSQTRRLTQTGVTGHFLRWTADSRSVIYRCPCGGNSQSMKVSVGRGEPQLIGEVAGGEHMSFSPDQSLILDVVGHKELWVSPLRGGKPEKVYEFADPAVRIDYPVWSPDGKWVLFDRFRPEGGDIWVMENFE